MSVTFLENVATYLYRNYRDELGDCAVVFPGRRAAVFFKRNLISVTDKTIWAPKLLTMSDFFKEQSGLLLADDLKLIFLLYQVYAEETKSQETFDQFYFWGNMLLNDFDDIDKYLADASQLFSNIESLKEIDEKFNGLSKEDITIIKQFWINFNPDQNTFHKQEFIKVWKALKNVYALFRERLFQQNLGYEGMIFRQVAEEIDKKREWLGFKWRKVFFVGMNAITPCEYKMMKALQREQKAEFFWDYDEYYLDNINEAGLFMADNIKNFPPPDFHNQVNNFKNISKNIKVISVASNIGQAKNIYRALEPAGNTENDEIIESCIVLGDENLLIPALYSLPEEIKKVNVTMGYPLNNSTIFHFVRLLIEMFQSAKLSGKNNILFYHQTIIPLLNHQYLSFWEKDVNGLLQYITEKNKIYVSSDILHKNPFFALLFQKPENTALYTRYLLNILFSIIVEMSENNKAQLENHNKGEVKYIQASLFSTYPEEGKKRDNYFDIEKEFIYQAYLIIKRLHAIFDELHLDVEMATFFKMVKKALQGGKVNFIGEPLAGLQIMGVLETRGLDFKNLVITSMNEGVFPKKTTAFSYIPYNLRKAFNLPTYEHQDAIYAYYFYRLLQRAENICLIYNSNPDGMNGGEMSRYIYQLLFTADLRVETENVEYHIKGSRPHPVSVSKNSFIESVLQKYIEGKGDAVLSPSAINSYKNCSMRFFFRYITGLKEPEEVQEDIDFAVFGNILHQAMKIIYSRLDQQDVNKKMLEEILHDSESVEKAIDEAFASQYFKEDTVGDLHYTGGNIIVREIIRKYIIGIIKNDIKTTPFKIISLEEKYHTTLSLFNGKMNINIGGTIDRIDEYKGKYRIIDYKTGRKHNRFKTTKDLFFPEKKGETDAIAQVFMYTMFFNKLSNSEHKPVMPALIYLRDIYMNDFSMNIVQQIEYRKNMEVDSFDFYENETKKYLTLLLEQLFGEDTCFTQTDDTDYCNTCSYREICHR